MSVTTPDRNRFAAPLVSRPGRPIPLPPQSLPAKTPAPDPEKKSQRRSWKHDDARLIGLWNDTEETLETIAEMLKRSIGGIRYRACFLRQHGVYLRDRKGGYLPEDVRLRALPPKPEKRACNLCDKVFQPRTRFERFCPTCRRNERMNNIGRVDGNWGLW